MMVKSKLTDVLDVFCPMHMIISPEGEVVHCGPTIAKLRDETLIGKFFFDVFHLKRPRDVSNPIALFAHVGTHLRLQFKDGPETQFKGMLVTGLDSEHAVVNLSFGISIIDGVRDYALTSADFAATDLTIEMLYLVEAKSAAMEASRKLNQRLQGAMIAAEEQAFTDTLTGLKNRRAVDHILARNYDWNTPFAVMQVDLDWFKAVNDTYGHAAGDHVLQTVARIMVEETRDNDTVARIGGDEFIIVLPETHERRTLDRIGRRIIARLSQPIPFEGESCKISASIGISLFETAGDHSVQEVLDNGDVALYASKRAGRARVTFYDPELRNASGADVSDIARA